MYFGYKVQYDFEQAQLQQQLKQQSFFCRELSMIMMMGLLGEKDGEM